MIIIVIEKSNNMIRPLCQSVLKGIFPFFSIILTLNNVKGQVIYHDYEPDLEIEYKVLTSDNKPTYYYFDLNNDSVNDFALVSYRHYADQVLWIEQFNGTQFTDPYKYDSITESDCHDTIKINQKIDSAKRWTSRDVYISWGEAGDTYIVPQWNMLLGFRIKNNEGYNYGWFRVGDSRVKDYAINMTADSAIIAGVQIDVKAEYVKIADKGDNRDGRDLNVSFEPYIDETAFEKYRVFIVKSDDVQQFTIDKALQVEAGNYIDLLPVGWKQSIVLNENSRDVNGELITELVSYNAIILCYSDSLELDNSNLSSPSNSLILKSFVNAVTNFQAKANYLSGKEYELNFSFDKVADEKTLKEYRILIIPESNLKGFTIETANSLIQGLYFEVLPIDNNYDMTISADSINDIYGNKLTNTANYKAYILSVADGKIKHMNNLSKVSGLFNLRSPTLPANSIVAEDNSNNGNGSDIKISLVNPAIIKGIKSYKIICVKLSEVNSFEPNNITRDVIGYYADIHAGMDSFEIFLKQDFRDIDGELIKENIPYRFYLMSIADSVSADIDAISDFSNILTLSEHDYLRAGQREGDNIVYVDVVPDIDIYVIRDTELNYYDFNEDLSSDFLFSVFQHTSPGNSAGTITIKPYKDRYFSITADSLYPEPLLLNSMISDDLFWYNKEIKFLEYNWVGKINDYGPWMKKKDRYLGFKYINSDKVIFGWIGFEVAGYSEYIIRDYAYQIINPELNNELINKNINIVPNPAELHIDINCFGVINVESIIISDYQGRIVHRIKNLEKNSENKTFNIDISSYKKSFYFAVIYTEGGVFLKKFLKI